MTTLAGQKCFDIFPSERLLGKKLFVQSEQNLQKIIKSDLFRPRLDLTYPLTCLPRKVHYLKEHVIYFTFFGWGYNAEKPWNFCRQSLLQPRTPIRPVRRVHVMPMATPIRRIGSTRVNSKGDDSPADSGGRRN
ncbi:MAG: hypothetical protein ABIJ45_02435 [Candidatus Zixiibacteriota bacterium]